MTAVADKLREARALIERGWTRGALERDGRVCMVGAVNMSLCGDAYWQLADTRCPEHRVRDAMWALLEDATGTPWLGDWNDKAKSKRPVLAAFDRAIELAEQESAA